MSTDAHDLDPYDVLGIARDATRGEVEAAWRRALRATHPDCNPADRDDRRVRDVLRAGRILRDPSRRAAWDRAHRGAPAPTARSRRPTWAGLAWDGGGQEADVAPAPGRIDVNHRKG